MELDPTLRDLSAPYIRSVLARLERRRPHFYKLLLRTTPAFFSVNLVYDYRAEPVREDTTCDALRSYSARDFLCRADTFHENDCFTISMLNYSVMFGIERDFTLEIMERIFMGDLHRYGRHNLYSDMVPVIDGIHGYSEQDAENLNKVMYVLNSAVMNGLQAQYDVLKTLRFIKK